MLRPPLASTLSNSEALRPSSVVILPEPQTSYSEPATPEAKKKSRNDLFSFDWSPGTPNIVSRTSTPPVASPPVGIPSPRPHWHWRNGQREKEAQARDEIKQSSGFDLPLTPPSPEVSGPVARRLSFGRDSEFGLQISTQQLDLSAYTPPDELDSAEQARRRHQGTGPLAPTAGISDNPVLDSRQSPRLRLVPISEYLLGEGRHASVYLASFVARNSLSPDQWTLCAAKRVLPDRKSQLAGLGEAFILSKLAKPTHPLRPESLAARGSPFILRLYGVRDERDGVETTGEVDSSTRRRKAWSDATSAASLGLGRPFGSTSQTDLRTASEASSSKLKLPHRRSLRRKKSFEPSNLSPPIGSPSTDGKDIEYFGVLADPLPLSRDVLLLKHQEVQRSKGPRRSAPGYMVSVDALASAQAQSNPVASTASTQVPPSDSPRIILMLEYAAYGHALDFAKRYPERMGKKRWLSWAKSIVAAVAWAHERGVLHADIKPQNILVAADLSIRLADFGMSMFLPAPGSSLPLPSDPLGLGSPSYSPPEFVRPPPSPFGCPSDIFSLGVTLMVLVSGREPYEGMRSVERMLWVGRGGFWDWETRRREGGLESASVSRAGSVRSGRSVSTRSRAGSGASRISLGGAGSAWSNPGGGGASGRRSGSVDSARSVGSAASGRARPRRLVESARRLLAPEAESSVAAESQNIPPPSPPLGSDDDEPEEAETVPAATASDVDENSEPFPTMAPLETYDDGTPVYYFLNEVDIVPQEVLGLLQAMTSPKPHLRPSARDVLAALDRL